MLQILDSVINLYIAVELRKLTMKSWYVGDNDYNLWLIGPFC